MFTSRRVKDVLTVDDYGAIRRARRDGKSIRQIASEFEHSRNTIRKILNQAEPNPLPSTRDRFAPLLGPVEAVIDQILIDDESAPPKQRHTAAQVFRLVFDSNSSVFAVSPFAMGRDSSPSWNHSATP